MNIKKKEKISFSCNGLPQNSRKSTNTTKYEKCRDANIVTNNKAVDIPFPWPHTR